MAEENVIHCLVADDHTIVRDGLAAILSQEADLRVVARASNGREALELFRLHRPHVTVMDLRMPEMDGITATRAIRAEFPQARIIILTTYNDEENVYQAVRAGVRGYLLKGSAWEDLLESIRAVHRGEIVIAPELAHLLAQHVSGIELTPREREVLNAMALGQSNQEIAHGLSIAESTVKTHVTNIFNKLHVNDRTQAVVAALDRGIVKLSAS
ncbi:MAG: Two-component response regulator [Chthonomonadaceae bacterium]|nr:Two-component response regulator [Chthonomonadaceae bacterium]